MRVLLFLLYMGLQPAPQRLFEPGHIQRFCNVLIHACVFRHHHIFGKGVGRHRNDGQILYPRFGQALLRLVNANRDHLQRSAVGIHAVGLIGSGVDGYPVPRAHLHFTCLLNGAKAIQLQISGVFAAKNILQKAAAGLHESLVVIAKVVQEELAHIRNVLTRKVIDLVDMSIDNGAQAQIWNDVDGENQTWRINLVPDNKLKAAAPAPAPVQAPPKPTRTQTGKGSRAKKAAGKAARRMGK